MGLAGQPRAAATDLTDQLPWFVMLRALVPRRNHPGALPSPSPALLTVPWTRPPMTHGGLDPFACTSHAHPHRGCGASHMSAATRPRAPRAAPPWPPPFPPSGGKAGGFSPPLSGSNPRAQTLRLEPSGWNPRDLFFGGVVLVRDGCPVAWRTVVSPACSGCKDL